jgi:thioredoxin reductase (NADPH)
MIRNYPGFSQGVTGAKLAFAAYQQAWFFGATFLFFRQLDGLSRQDDGHYRLHLSDGGTITARTVVIANGVTYRRLGAPSLEAMAGRGVFYGAGVSEAAAMRGQKVFVVGGGTSAGQAALHLAKWAERVTILVRSPSLADGMSDYLIREIGAAPNIEVGHGVQVVDGTGADHLESLVLEDTRTGARRRVPADALFILIGSEPRTEWLGESVARDCKGFILTGQDVLDDPGAAWAGTRPPLPQETSLPGVFAAGDVRRGSVKRVASAVGEGAVTIPLVHRYLESLAVPEAVGR